MKASELIKSLEEAIRRYGDLDVYSMEECWFCNVGEPQLKDLKESGTKEGEDGEGPCLLI